MEDDLDDRIGVVDVEVETKDGVADRARVVNLDDMIVVVRVRVEDELDARVDFVLLVIVRVVVEVFDCEVVLVRVTELDLDVAFDVVLVEEDLLDCILVLLLEDSVDFKVLGSTGEEFLLVKDEVVSWPDVVEKVAVKLVAIGEGGAMVSSGMNTAEPLPGTFSDMEVRMVEVDAIQILPTPPSVTPFEMLKLPMVVVPIEVPVFEKVGVMVRTPSLPSTT